MNRDKALVPLVAPHMFLRFLGLSFLVPGVVAPSLPAAFAIPAAYGDSVAGILAIAAMVALAKHATWAIPAVWLFNVWGAADFLFAIFPGRARAHSSWLAGRGVLHPDGDRATTAGHALPHLPAY